MCLSCEREFRFDAPAAIAAGLLFVNGIELSRENSMDTALTPFAYVENGFAEEMERLARRRIGKQARLFVLAQKKKNNQKKKKVDGFADRATRNRSSLSPSRIFVLSLYPFLSACPLFLSVYLPYFLLHLSPAVISISSGCRSIPLPSPPPSDLPPPPTLPTYATHLHFVRFTGVEGRRNPFFFSAWTRANTERATWSIGQANERWFVLEPGHQELRLIEKSKSPGILDVTRPQWCYRNHEYQKHFIESTASKKNIELQIPSIHARGFSCTLVKAPHWDNLFNNPV